MSKEDFRELLDRLGLKPDVAAKLAGTSLRAVYRYLEGTRRVPPAVAAYLRLYGDLGPIGQAAERDRAGVSETGKH